MKPGEKKRVRLQPEKAFGQVQALEIRAFPSVKTLPKVMVMEPAGYKRHFQTEPALEAEVPLTPYFKGRVIAFEGQNAVIAVLASEGSVEESFGTTKISIENDEITIKMEARVGADFVLDGKSGRITKTGDRNFTVDFNHPLAGREMVLEVEVVSLVKAENINETPLPWMEDHDQGVQAGARQDRPIFLLLYADWCDWCKKLMAESLQDARVKMFRDDFVWVRVDSGKGKAVGEAYEQNTFPLIVILNPKGEVVKKIDGYRDAAALKKELEGVL
jgi:FKBP-type peptidyl-prolyl cis-trans isomerase 2